MKPITVSVSIGRPRQEVFDHLNVLANHEAFCDHFLVDWQLSGPPAGVGGKVRFRALAPGRSEWAELTVVAVEEPSRTVEETLGAGGRRLSRGTFTLAEAGPDATALTFELALVRSPLYERPMLPLLRPWLAKQNTRAMERLKEQLEAPALSAAS